MPQSDQNAAVHACMGGHLEVLRWLQAAGVDLNTEDDVGVSACFRAATAGGHLQVAQYMAERLSPLPDSEYNHNVSVVPVQRWCRLCLLMPCFLLCALGKQDERVVLSR